MAAHQQKAVALQRLLLGAHQGHPTIRGLIQHAIQRALETIGRRHPLIVGRIAPIQRRIGRLSAQSLAQKYVGDARFLERLLQRRLG